MLYLMLKFFYRVLVKKIFLNALSMIFFIWKYMVCELHASEIRVHYIQVIRIKNVIFFILSLWYTSRRVQLSIRKAYTIAGRAA